MDHLYEAIEFANHTAPVGTRWEHRTDRKLGSWVRISLMMREYVITTIEGVPGAMWTGQDPNSRDLLREQQAAVLMTLINRAINEGPRTVRFYENG